jgi:hypothetical protein
MGPEAQKRLRSPSLSITQQLGTDAEELLDRRGPFGVLGELDVRAEWLRIVRRIGADWG